MMQLIVQDVAETMTEFRASSATKRRLFLFEFDETATILIHTWDSTCSSKLLLQRQADTANPGVSCRWMA